MSITGNSVKYLIITDDRFYNNIKPLANYKTRQGIPAEIINLSQIGNDPNVIKQFIKSKYNSYHMDYVLLVGDIDILPMGLGSYNFDNNIPGDYSYTLMDQDYFADFGIGRISANSCSEVDNIVNKILAYETNPPIGNWTDSALFVANKEIPYENCKRDIKYAHSGGHNIELLYGSLGSTNEEITNKINSGVGTVNYRGHGDSDGWFQWNNNNDCFTTTNIHQLNNGRKTPVVFSIACETSRFDGNSESMAEAFMKTEGGAVAFLGAVRTTREEPNSVYDQSIYNKLLDTENTKLSQITNAAARDMINYAGYDPDPKKDIMRQKYYNAFLNLLSGDPSLDVYTDIISQIPGISITDNNGTVTVTTGIDCDICISGGINGTEVYSFTSGVGVRTNSVTTPIRPLYICISAHNYVPFNAITGGSLSSNQTLYYNLNVFGNLTITSGTTLTFLNNSSLFVNGSLNANGAIFDFQQQSSSSDNGIRISSTGTANISNSEIKNARYGIKVDQAPALTVDNCNIHDCYYGISLNSTNTNPNENILLTNNTITGNYFGVKTYYSNPLLLNNTITSNSGVGLYSGVNSNTKLGNIFSGGYNKINSNYTDVLVENTNTVLGLGGSYGQNSFTANTNYDLYGWISGVIYAENNYWGGYTGQKYIQNGAIDCIPYLTYDPTPQGLSTPYIINNIEGSTNLSSYTSVPDKKDNSGSLLLNTLAEAYSFYFLGNQKEAALICKYLIENYPDSAVSFNAVSILFDMGKHSDNNPAKNYLPDIASSKDKKDINGYTELLLTSLDMNNLVSNYDKIIDKYGKAKTSELALFYKFSYYFDGKNDIKNAGNVLEMMRKDFPDSKLTELVEMFFNGIKGRKQLGRSAISESQEKTSPENYKLYENYPNPFNPSTKIMFSLAEKNMVTLKVFDLLGREISTLLNEERQAGMNEVMFNADGLPSGMYIYTIKSGNYSESKKMLLMR